MPFSFIPCLRSYISLEYEPYATLDFRDLPQPADVQNARDNSTGPTVDMVRPHDYGNLNDSGEPLPGLCRGIIPYQRPYVNNDTQIRPRYAKLLLFNSIVLDWLRNTWGKVDQLGQHVYDELFRGRGLRLPYDKVKITVKNPDGVPRNQDGAVDENGDAVYDEFGRRPKVILPGVGAGPSSEVILRGVSVDPSVLSSPNCPSSPSPNEETDEVNEIHDDEHALEMRNLSNLTFPVC